MWLKLKISARTRLALRWPPILLLVLFASNLLAADPDPDSNSPIFARINDRIIHYDEFMSIFHAAVRYKYYHGEVPQKELISFQRQVGEDIVEQELLHQQALKLGLKPDTEKIQQGLAEFDKKYQDRLGWQAQKEKNMGMLLDRLNRQDIIEQMQHRIRSIEKSDSKAVQAFYKKHPEKFTEPARFWVSVILLSVPPSSSESTWQDAKRAAKQFIGRIRQGENFTDIARRYSAHPSVVNGGDLGYLHQGMLEGNAKDAVDNLNINEVSEPVRVLEGFAVFLLNGIQSAKLKPFNEVEERATRLLYREMQEKAWQNYLIKLTQSSNVFINEKLYALIDER
jgi:parvulin-like peptidyl-prolyl isomerase